MKTPQNIIFSRTYTTVYPSCLINVLMLTAFLKKTERQNPAHDVLKFEA